MRLLFIFLSACVIFAALKLAIVALSVLFGISLLWGFYLRPVEVAGFLVYCATLTLIGAHPALSLSIIALAVILSQIGKKSS